MKIKKYTGSTTFEAMTKLKKDLGPEAVVLNTRTIKKKGLFNIFKKPIVEITAAYKVEELTSNQRFKYEELNKIDNELVAIKKMMENISDSTIKTNSELPVELRTYETSLIENGVEYSVARLLLKELSEQINFEGKDKEDVNKIVKYALLEYIGEVKPLQMNSQYQKVVFFIGATGVGKTTTLAKIAAQLVMKKKYDIGLITSDTYRIGAIEQLKTYSDILKLPLEVSYNQEDMNRILFNYKEKNLLFVDTAGRSHKDINIGDKIYKTMNSINNKEIYLVLSGTTDYNTLKSIIEHYNFIEDYKIILTKIDECESFGNILNIKHLTQNPIAYITTGQDVPSDIEVLDKEKVVSSLIGEN